GIPSSLANKGQEHRPFSRREISHLGKDTDAAIAAKFGRHPMVIRLKRVRLGIPAFRPMAPLRRYTEADIALMGTDTDRAIAAIMDRHPTSVAKKRKELGIPAFRAPAQPEAPRPTRR